MSITLSELVELQVGAHHRERRLAGTPERDLGAAAVHLRLVFEHVAAGGVDAVEPDPGRCRGVAKRHARGASLRPQVAVPDHLGERHRHEEAAAHGHHGPERHLAPREVQPGVARLEVVADDRGRQRGSAAVRDLVVDVVAVVETPSDARLEGPHGHLDPRARPEHVAIEVQELEGLLAHRRDRDVPGPLVASDRVAGEPEGRVLLLVDGRRVLGEGGGRDGQRGEPGRGDEGAFHAPHSNRVSSIV
jgi:hypothetical protein